MIKTFSQVNDEVVIPKVRMGLSDFIFMFFTGIFAFFGFVLLEAIIPVRVVFLFGCIYYAFWLALFFKIRSMYIKDGKSNILWKKYDYIFQGRQVWSGREEI